MRVLHLENPPVGRELGCVEVVAGPDGAHLVEVDEDNRQVLVEEQMTLQKIKTKTPIER